MIYILYIIVVITHMAADSCVLIIVCVCVCNVITVDVDLQRELISPGPNVLEEKRKTT